MTWKGTFALFAFASCMWLAPGSSAYARDSGSQISTLSSEDFCAIVSGKKAVHGKLRVQAYAELEMVAHYDIHVARPECPRYGALLIVPDALDADPQVRRFIRLEAASESNPPKILLSFVGTFAPADKTSPFHRFTLIRLESVGEDGAP